jgi:uncharacterized protein (TIGR03435 family)
MSAPAAQGFALIKPNACLVCAATLALVLPACACAPLHAQNPDRDWEKAAGGKQQFDVASVRPETGEGRPYSNFSLDNGNAYWVVGKNDQMNPQGTLFSAKYQTLMRYISFAYKLSGTQELALRFDYYKGLELHTPDWVRNDRYDIEARAPAGASKDQMRMMMQSLLAERFKLQVHWETQQAPVFAMLQANPGKLGPQMVLHQIRDDCASMAPPQNANQKTATAVSLSSLPIPCGEIAHLPPSAPDAHRFGGRNVPLAQLAASIPAQTGLVTAQRPIIDRTGLAGGYNFWLEWTPEDTSEVDNRESGGTFREALKNQLGLKLVPERGAVQVLVIDHVEQPGEN